MNGKHRGGVWMACVGVALLGLGCASQTASQRGDATDTPSERAEDYYPLLEGWHWAYDVHRGDEKILAVYRVVARQGERATLMASEERIEYAVLPDGIARTTAGSGGLSTTAGTASEAVAPGDFILRNPIRSGNSWPIIGGTASITAHGRTVTLEVGSFANCVVVEENRTNPARIIRTTYAPGVGPIAIEYQVHDVATGQFTTALKAQLRGVTRPGADPLQ